MYVIIILIDSVIEQRFCFIIITEIIITNYNKCDL